MSEPKKQTAKDIVTSYDGPKLRIMEVCGTHTHEIFRLGIRNILPDSIDLISGPGCPVCVTPVGFIDEAVMLALDYGCTICTFGDLVRVPGTEKSLAKARSEGAKIRIVYTPTDAADYAKEHTQEQVVFLAVGFETTTPSSLLAVRNAKRDGLTNFSILTANKTMTNAYRALKGSADAFLYPGHVNAITGAKACRVLADEGIYGVICGFTANEILTGLAVTIRRLEAGEPFFENCYPRVVTEEGSKSAQAIMEEMAESCDSEWRGLGVIPDSGLQLRAEYADYDARKKYDLPKVTGKSHPACRCADVLRGDCKPTDCKVFGKGCTPQHPIGACMVSNEGSCAAYYAYGGLQV